MPALHHGQGVEELAAEVRRASRLPGESGKRLEDRRRSLDATEPGLNAPEGDQYAGRHPEFLLGALEQALVLGHHVLASGHHGFRDAAVRVLREAGVEFGLATVALDDALERRKPGQRFIDQAIAEALAECLRPQVSQPVVEALRSVNGDSRH